MDRAEQRALDDIADRLAATEPDLADLLTATGFDDPAPGVAPAAPRGADARRRAAAAALGTATVGLVVLVAGFAFTSTALAVLGLLVMIVVPAPVAAGVARRAAGVGP